MEIEINADIFQWFLKQEENLSLFLYDWYWEKYELTDSPGHDGKPTLDTNLVGR